MITAFFEKLDSIDYFVSSREEALAGRNKTMLKQLCNFIAIFSIIFLIFKYANNPGVLPDFGYVILLAVLLFYNLQYRLWLSKAKLSFKVTRLIILINYSLLFAAVSYLEVCVVSASHLLLILALIMAFPTFYTDYFRIVVFFEILAGGIYYIVFKLFESKEFIWQHFFLIILGIIFSLLIVMINFGNQAESASEEKIFKEKSDTDGLTDLKNKIAFEEEARAAILDRTPGTALMLLILDFDNFKYVNDYYGHQVGDDVLKAFAKLLKREFRIVDIIGRVGGDEFMVIIRELPSGNIHLIENRCKNILHELNILKVGDARSFSCSIGIAADECGLTFEALYRLADDALYESKCRGKGRFTTYVTKEIQKTAERMIYILSNNDGARRLIRETLDANCQVLEGTDIVRGLNDISLYQDYLNEIYIQMDMPGITTKELEDYMASRPVFSRVQLHRF